MAEKFEVLALAAAELAPFLAVSPNP